MAYDPNNIFARVLRGELPSHRVYEDEHTVALMDLRPQAPGHTLVLPRAAAENIFELGPDELAAAARTARKVAQAVKRAFNPPGLIIAQLNGPDAGQTIFHFHFHVLPRYAGADFEIRLRDPEDPAVLAEHAARIRAALE